MCYFYMVFKSRLLMKSAKSIKGAILLSLLLFILSNCKTHGQLQHIVSVPIEGNCWISGASSNESRITWRSGIQGLKDTALSFHTYFKTEMAGDMNISVVARARHGKSSLTLSHGTERRKLSVSNPAYDTLSAGTFHYVKPGYQQIELKLQGSSDGSSTDITSLIVSGPVTGGKIYFVKDDFYFGRRGPSVHLRYDIPTDASDIEWFYNELTIPEGNDVTGSYYMADGFADGYFGMQVNSPSERRILFSVWSPYKTDKPGEIPEEYRIKMLKKGRDVITREFGNEGSGGQSYKVFSWKSEVTYRFLLNGRPAQDGCTDYTAYFFAPETGKWELIASFRRPKTNSYLRNLYSFLENFDPETGNVTRKGYYANQWIIDTKGIWHELTGARFTADGTARKEARLDYSGGSEQTKFFLRNCGFFDDTTTPDTHIARTGTGKHPEIDFKELK
jgi:hypothetical protein